MPGFLPGFTPADLHIQRNRQLRCTAHLFHQDTLCSFPFPLCNLKDDLVVHLQEHTGFQVFVAQASVNINHRDFNNVCCSTLNWGVQRGPFSRLTPGAVGRV